MPTSPLERNPVTPPSVVTGQGGARPHGNDGAAGVVGPAFGSGSTIPVSDSAAGSAVLEEAAPLPADLTINNEQEWTLRS